MSCWKRTVSKKEEVKRTFDTEFKAHKIQQPLENVQENCRKITWKQISLFLELLYCSTWFENFLFSVFFRFFYTFFPIVPHLIFFLSIFIFKYQINFLFKKKKRFVVDAILGRKWESSWELNAKLWERKGIWIWRVNWYVF